MCFIQIQISTDISVVGLTFSGGVAIIVVTSIIVITRRERDLIITEPRQKTLISQNEA